MHRLERDYAGQIGFVYLDVDDPAVAPFKKQLPYRGIPTLVLLDAQGNVVKQWFGLVGGEQLTHAFDALLAGQPIP